MKKLKIDDSFISQAPTQYNSIIFTINKLTIYSVQLQPGIWQPLRRLSLLTPAVAAALVAHPATAAFFSSSFRAPSFLCNENGSVTLCARIARDCDQQEKKGCVLDIRSRGTDKGTVSSTCNVAGNGQEIGVVSRSSFCSAEGFV